jgi:hypothetical protein
VRETRSPLQNARTAISFAWMNLTAVVATTVALLPLAVRGRPFGRLDRAGRAVEAPEQAPVGVELEAPELRSVGQ